MVIYVSDGHSDETEGSQANYNAATQLKSSGVDVYTVALTDSPNLSELNAINSDPDADYSFNINSSNDYTAAANALLDVLCGAKTRRDIRRSGGGWGVVRA